MRKLVCSLIILLLATSAFAGGRGGHNITFDPNSYGGGWTTITCTGVQATDDTAFTNFANAAIAANPAKAKLYIPPGGNCNVLDKIYFNGIQNLIVWMYGATINFAQMGADTFFQDTAHNAFIQSASAGATTLTLITSSDASKFSVGDLINVNALNMQSGGFPSNWNFFEYNIITAINGGTGVITLGSPLVYSYSSSYPNWDGATNDGGPANISKMQPNWNRNLTWFGGHITGHQCLGTGGRTIAIYDVVWDQGPCIGASDNTTIVGSVVGGNSNVEVDKSVNNLNLIRIATSQLSFQSSSVNNVLVVSSTFPTIPGPFGFNGTPTNLTVINSFGGFPGLRVNPAGYGHTVNVVIDGTMITAAGRNIRAVADSWFSFSGGVFTIANADPNRFHVFEFAVPGQKYYNSMNDGTPCASVVPFTITALAVVASNTTITTDLVSKPSCGAQVLYYSPYSMATLKQLNSPAGSVDLSPFAAP